MIVRWLAVAVLLWSATAAQAAEWWCVAVSAGDAPNRTLAYVDLATVHQNSDGTTDVWGLTVFESPLTNTERYRSVHFGFHCGRLSAATLGGTAYDSEGKALTDVDIPTLGFAPAEANSVNELVMRMACRMPSNRGIPVEEPMRHAFAYLRDHTFTSTGPETAQQPQQGPEQPQQGAEQPAQSSTSFGTAFFVGPGGFALTAYHVVDGADRIACRTIDGTLHEAVVTRMNQANDLALLRVSFRPTRYLGLAPQGSLRPGQRVFTFGYGAPSYLGINEPRFTEGVVSALSGLEANDAEVQITVPIQPGNSGGPLVNEAGQLVGIITSSAATDTFEQEVGATPQSINWAVKADYAAPLLPPHPPARPMTRAQAIALTRDSLCFVMALHSGDDNRGAAR